jgi:hypothetical protein
MQSLTIINKLKSSRRRKTHEYLTPDPWTDFTVDEIIKVIKEMHNWKYPGLDRLLNFWVKLYCVMHEEPTRAINDAIKNQKLISA